MSGLQPTRLAAAALLLWVAGCGRDDAGIPAPQEITDAAVAEFCGMSLDEHPGPKAQIFLTGAASPHWFASVHDAFAYTMLQDEPKEIAAIYVSDMGRVKHWDHPEPGTWIDARKAVFVIGSRRRGGMDENEAVPFADRAAADAFIAQYGGSAVGFAAMPRSYVLTDGSPAKQAAERPAGTN